MSPDDRITVASDTRAVDPRLAELSRTISAAELGRRIRAARVAAGMTQAQVTAGEVTAAYLSRIEDGQRRPEAHLLDRMAVRMGTTMQELLTGLATRDDRELELQVERSAVTLGLGDATEALSLSTAAVERSEARGDVAMTAYARRVQAAAHRALGNIDVATDLLEDLVIQPTSDLNTLRALIELCRCHCDADQFARAVAAGEAAQRMLDDMGIRGLPEALQLAAALAVAHRRRGAVRAASAISRSALATAGRNSNQFDQASAYWHASVTESATNGATPAAIELAQAALALIDLDAGHRTIDLLTEIAAE